jgi:leader peptidase (prepilin peptidase)/N-methyltransferase
LDSFLGILAGGGILLATGFLGSLIFRKEAMGGGDVKLLAMIGAYVGWKQVCFVYLFSPVLAVPFALYAKLILKAETIPYGPYLALTGAVFFIYGDFILQSLLGI